MSGIRAFAERAFDPAAIPGKPEALAGIRVLEVASRIFGPATADYLGLFGAEVIKVEMPPRGDLMRYVAPEGFFWKEMSPAFLSLNRNKLHVGRIVYAANSGFGQWGPFSAGRASYDATAQAVSGFSAVTGFPDQPPLKAGFWVGDYTAALMSATAILAALAARRRTGEGQMIDLSQAEAMIRTLDWTWPYAGLTGKDRSRNGNVDPSYPPSGIYRCRDGFVAVSARDEGELIPLAHAVGATDPEEAKIATPERVEAYCATRGVDEVVRVAENAGFSAAPVRGGKHHYHDPHLRARGTVCSVDDPLYGRVDEYGPGPKLSESPGRIKWSAKPVGWHNDRVFGDLLGMTAVERKALERKKVIGKWADVPGARPPEGSTAT
ncbi:MAG: putative acyl-CoA transferase/carnitine dehydratase [Deltaproteobacteria bacterium]|nr:putative acyl-CoA transferase/carnitine dehydratase [Deltaproteobacteria bacterium]